MRAQKWKAKDGHLGMKKMRNVLGRSEAQERNGAAQWARMQKEASNGWYAKTQAFGI